MESVKKVGEKRNMWIAIAVTCTVVAIYVSFVVGLLLVGRRIFGNDKNDKTCKIDWSLSVIARESKYVTGTGMLMYCVDREVTNQSAYENVTTTTLCSFESEPDATYFICNYDFEEDAFKCFSKLVIHGLCKVNVNITKGLFDRPYIYKRDEECERVLFSKEKKKK